MQKPEAPNGKTESQSKNIAFSNGTPENANGIPENGKNPKQNAPQNAQKDIALYRLEDGKPEDVAARADKKNLPEGVTSGMLYRDVVRIAWPSFIELMLTQLTSMADQMMVGDLGSYATTAVGLTTQPKFLMSTMFIALNVGAMAMVARNKGAGRQDKARLILRQALMLNIVFSLAFSIIGFFSTEWLVRFMSGGDAISETAIAAGVSYLKIQFAGMFSLAITTTITNCLRGAGDSRTAMVYNTMANVVNVIFNYLLIYGKFGFPRLGVAGASIATVIGQVCAMCMALWAVLRKKGYIALEFPKGWFKPDGESIRAMTKIGLPSMVEQMAMRVGVVIFSITIAGLGDQLFATHTICMSIQALTFMNGQAFAVSATSLVGQSLGKLRGDMAELYASRTRRVGMLVSVCIAVCIFFFGKNIILLYNDTEPIIAQRGALILKMVALIQPLQASQFILSGALRGAGDTRYTAVVIMITVMIVRPLVALLAINVLGWSLEGAWIALIADQLLRTLLIWLRFNTGKWKTVIKTRARAAA